jgi:AcrR family transcriptional regulator
MPGMPDRPDRPYHHGRLRATLLAEAERTLREHGTQALSLRDLARQAGVSHAAPRRHFADRQALLDALAESGFTRLAGQIQQAAGDAGQNHAGDAGQDHAGDAEQDYSARLRAVATAYVEFATRDPALLELMFAAKRNSQPGPLHEAADRLFSVVGELIRQGQQAGQLPPGDPDRLLLLLVATLQGIAALLTTGRAQPGQAEALISDTVALFARDRR